MLSHRRSRRQFLKSAALVAAAAAIAACAGPPPATPTSPAPATSAGGPAPAPAPTTAAAAVVPGSVGPGSPAPAAAKPAGAGGGLTGTIELYFARTRICRLCGAVDYWNERNPNAKVVDKDTPWNGQKQAAALAAGQGGPDLYQADVDVILRDSLSGKLLDFSDTVKEVQDQYLRLEVYRNPKTGKFYGMPWQVGITAMFYRQDLLQKLGRPEFPKGWTWDQHEELAVQAKKDLNVNTLWLGAGAAAKDCNLFMQLVWQAGGSLISKDWTQVQVDGPISLDVARRLKRWWTKGLIFEGSFYTPPLWGALREGLLWNTVDPSWWLLGMNDNISKPEDHAGDWRITAMPLFQPGGARTAHDGDAGLTAPAYTKNPDLVRAFARFATTDLNATVPTIKMGALLTAKSSFSDASVLDITYPVTDGQKVNTLYAELVKEIPTTFYYSASFPEIREMLSQRLLTLLKSNSSLEEGMKGMADDARKIHERWLRQLDELK